MDSESLAAMREAALDYFTRSRAIARRRARMEQPGSDEAEGWRHIAELGWPGMLAPESAGGLALGLDGAAEILRAAGE
uniref:acyl-CoA dehydrogenase family protein n=1 Tax=Variovorax sp. E3 TaxID=1914993 RepID=UPI0018DC6DA1